MSRSSIPGWFVLFLLAATSGLLLFASDFPLHLWPVQAVALVPWLIGLYQHCRHWLLAGISGMVLGLCMLIPMALLLDLPLPLTFVLVTVLSTLWGLMSLGIYRVLRWSAPWGVLATGSVAVLIECLDFYLLPIWGTAQCFARVWSAGPWFIQLVELTGITGLVFFLVTSQAALVKAIFGPQAQRRAHVIVFLLVLAVFGAINGLLWPRQPEKTLRVGALGWVVDGDPARMPIPANMIIDTFLEPLLKKAASKGAKLIVSPEIGMRLTATDRQDVIHRLGAMARIHQVVLAVGYFDVARNDNRLVFIDESGLEYDEYVKTHLIPFMEKYNPGNGRLVIWDKLGVRLGGMICQDDNFTDLSRGYGREKVQVMAVPTNDWLQVQHYHLENSIFRAVESRYGVVRATVKGISAIISPRGEILSRADHYDEGPQAIVADLPVFSRSTLYSWAGEWLALLCVALIAIGYWQRRSEL